MVLEACVVCVDNSEYMRNGDYTPNRSEAQTDAVHLLVNAKTGANPESTVGLITLAGKRPEVLVTLTTDLTKLLTTLGQLPSGGEIDFVTGIQVAQLILKHRQNKNQHQRIVSFVGSPIKASNDQLLDLAKKLKQNNVAIDVVNFGEEAQNSEKLEAFIAAVNTNNNSHLISVPPGPHILSDVLVASPLFFSEDGMDMGAGGAAAGAGAAAGGAAGGAANAAFGGIDPNMDPELAEAMRLSLEEENERRRREAAAAAPAAGAPAPAGAGGASGASGAGGGAMAPAAAATGTEGKAAAPAAAAKPAAAAAPAAGAFDIDMSDVTDEERAMLQEAIRMSMAAGSAGGAPATPAAKPPAAAAPAKPAAKSLEELSEEEQMRMAYEMSLQSEQAERAGAGAKTPAAAGPAATPAAPQKPPSQSRAAGGGTEEDMNAAMADPAFLSDVLGSLPGVDPNDPAIKSVLASFKKDDAKKDESKKDEPKK